MTLYEQLMKIFGTEENITKVTFEQRANLDIERTLELAKEVKHPDLMLEGIEIFGKHPFDEFVQIRVYIEKQLIYDGFENELVWDSYIPIKETLLPDSLTETWYSGDYDLGYLPFKSERYFKEKEEAEKRRLESEEQRLKNVYENWEGFLKALKSKEFDVLDYEMFDVIKLKGTYGNTNSYIIIKSEFESDQFSQTLKEGYLPEEYQNAYYINAIRLLGFVNGVDWNIRDNYPLRYEDFAKGESEKWENKFTELFTEINNYIKKLVEEKKLVKVLGFDTYVASNQFVDIAVKAVQEHFKKNFGG